MFECFNNPLESTLVLHFCAILGRICVFLFPKAPALEHVPLPIDECLHKFGFSDIYIYIYMCVCVCVCVCVGGCVCVMYFQVCT